MYIIGSIDTWTNTYWMGDPHTHTHSQAAAQLVDANRPASIIIFSSFSIVLCYWFAIHSLAFLLSFARDSDPRGRTLRLCCVLSPGVAPIFRPVGHDSYHTTGPKRDTHTQINSIMYGKMQGRIHRRGERGGVTLLNVQVCRWKLEWHRAKDCCLFPDAHHLIVASVCQPPANFLFGDWMPISTSSSGKSSAAEGTVKTSANDNHFNSEIDWWNFCGSEDLFVLLLLNVCQLCGLARWHLRWLSHI